MRDFFRVDTSQREEKPEKPGVIDTIGLGYSYLIAYPYVIIIPILLDLYLWLGLRITSDPAIVKVASWIQQLSSDGDDNSGFLDRFNDTNIFELASLQLFTFRVPTFVPLVSELGDVRTQAWDPAIESAPWWLVIVTVLIMLTLSLMIGSSYLTWMAGTLADPESTPNFRSVVSNGLQILAWVGLLIALFMLISSPVILTIIGIQIAGLPQASFVALLFIFPIAFGFVFFFFSVYAIVVDRLSAVASLRASYQVVRNNFVQTLGFIAAFFLVTSGFPYFWRLIISNPAGALIAIIGNAFVASGMVASAMVFYRDRAPSMSELALSQEG